MNDRVILVGIDEAGYGPILGPLVVSAAAFEVPRALAEACLWEVLRGSVHKSMTRRDRRICIIDSKKLHAPEDGLARLERSALAAVAAHSEPPATTGALMGLVSPWATGPLLEYPWYGDLNAALPIAADAGGIRIAAKRLREDMSGAGVKLAALWSEVLPEGHYNALVDKTRNKAAVLMGLTLRLIQRTADMFPGRDISFFVDKQGGRDHYGGALMKSFDDRHLRILEEDREGSAYELTREVSRWRVSFRSSGESRHLTTALASILSKYLREALMHSFNGYWAARVPGVRPTAGYYDDGRRFLTDIADAASRMKVSQSLLVRSR